MYNSLMKNIFEFDISDGRTEAPSPNLVFVSARVDSDTDRKTEEAASLVSQKIKSSSMPALFGFLKLLLLLVGFLGLMRFFLPDDSGNFEQHYAAFPAGFFVSAGLVLLGGGLWVFEILLAKRQASDPELKRLTAELDACMRQCVLQLGAPENAHEIDVLLFFYREKNGKRKKANIFNDFSNMAIKAWQKDESLFFCDCETAWEFPLSEIKSVHKINKRVMLSDWNKKTPPNKGKFKQYKMCHSGLGVSMKYYWAVRLERQGEIYEFFVPCYEIEPILELTGLKISQSPD